MLNNVILQGNTTKDIELKTTQSGISFCNFTLAVSRKYKSGEDKITDFVECRAWRHTAEFLSRYVQKGSQIVVRGELQNNNWTDKDGNKRYSYVVVVDDVNFCGSKSDTAQKPSEPKFEDIDTDSDLPF